MPQPTVGFGLASPTPLRARSSACSMKWVSWEFTVSVEKRVGVGLGVERDEVVDLFAGAYEADWQAYFAPDGYDDATPRGAIPLGQDHARHADSGSRLARLRQSD